MTLPASFPLSMSQIATELGTSLPLNLLHADVLALTDGAAPVSFSDLLGASAQLLEVTHVDSGATTSNNLNGYGLGDAASGRLIIAVLFHHDTTGSPGTSPAMTLNGNAMTLRIARSSGSGGGPAAGCAIFTITEPTGTTGDFTVTDVSWAGLGKSLVVYRALGYTVGTTAGDSVGATTATSFPFDLNPASDGAMVCAFATGSSSAFTHSWTNATESGESAFGQSNKCSWTLNTGLSSGLRTITPTVSSLDWGSSVGMTLTPS